MYNNSLRIVEVKMNDEKLDILVVEDEPKHQESARVLLANHDIQIVGNFDEAADLITGGSKYSPNQGNKRNYDAVLTDLFIPQGRGDCIADNDIVQQQMPFGYPIALMATKEGIPYVAVVSDANHHEDPIGYSLDFFVGKDNNTPEVMDLDVYGAGCSRLALMNTMYIDQAYKTPDGKIGTKDEIGEIIEEEEEEHNEMGLAMYLDPAYQVPEGSELVKNWKYALDKLME
jgi:CheY-like chemotaxis protein